MAAGIANRKSVDVDAAVEPVQARHAATRSARTGIECNGFLVQDDLFSRIPHPESAKGYPLAATQGVDALLADFFG